MSLLWRCYPSVLVMLFCSTFVVAQQPVIVTYAGGYRGNIINYRAIEANKITHLLYAFADVYKHKAHLNYPKTDDQNLKNILLLKQVNPNLKVLISIGGLGWSRNFSDMALTGGRRKIFANSCAKLLMKYQLDGVDIDWEFPGYAGEGGNKFRPEDKQNYTLMFKALRQEFDYIKAQTGKSLLITTAVDGWASHWLPHTQMYQVQQYTDYIMLMAYNFNVRGKVGGHFLFSPNGWPADGSADGAVKAFIQAGVPAHKLVLGIGFFPAAFKMAGSNANNTRYLSRPVFKGGLARVNRMINKRGFKRFWDEQGQSPYLFNSTTMLRISYEDEASVKAKAAYIKQNKIAGAMYWDYFSDPERMLLKTLYHGFHATDR